MSTDDKEWSEYRSRFAHVYDNANYLNPLQSFAMRASHRLAENPFVESDYFGRVLEIGAGTGEHFSFVMHKFDKYFLTDASHETLDVAKTKLNNLSGEVIFDRQDGAALTYTDNSFDRVIATHVLEHIYQPHNVLKEWARVTKSGGVLTVLIPTDPGFAWRLGRSLGPRRNAIRIGVAYDYVMAREHVNSCNNLIAFLRHYFPCRTESWWPFALPSIDLNLFFAYHAIIRK
jgi:phosphatidylethanolamine/phosphatidyl-N-methylethanolamine N-methyltransferase